MYQGMFDDLDKLFRWMAVVAFILIPLALWKLVDIAVWLFKHIDITFN